MAITAMSAPVHSLWFLHHPQFRSLIVLALLCAGCKKDEPLQPHVPSIQLTVEDASCTEAWLKASSSEIPITITLLRDNHRVQILQLSTSDSLLIDEGLLPNHGYVYQLQKLGVDSSVIETTKPLQVSTMDTTSHNYTWQIDTLGDGSSSVLYDAAIINDTLAYAVGAIYLRDSVGNWDPNAYNMVKWNGNRWELMRVQFYTFCNQPSTGSYPAKSIFAFSPTDVWIGMDGSQVVHWNGQTQSAPMCTPVSINKLWGDNPNSVWAVGNNGGIAHYNGSTWQRVESGVTANMQDVWGYTDPNLGTRVVFSVGGTSGNVKLLTLSPTAARDTLSWPSMEDAISIWTTNGSAIYAAGVGIWRHRGSSWQRMGGLPCGILFTRVRGSSSNNIFAVGSFGTLVHWNGTNWCQYGELPTDFRYQGIAVSQNMVVAVGFSLSGVFADRAAVVIGRRVR